MQLLHLFSTCVPNLKAHTKKCRLHVPLHPYSPRCWILTQQTDLLLKFVLLLLSKQHPKTLHLPSSVTKRTLKCVKWLKWLINGLSGVSSGAFQHVWHLPSVFSSVCVFCEVVSGWWTSRGRHICSSLPRHPQAVYTSLSATESQVHISHKSQGQFLILGFVLKGQFTPRIHKLLFFLLDCGTVYPSTCH